MSADEAGRPRRRLGRALLLLALLGAGVAWMGLVWRRHARETRIADLRAERSTLRRELALLREKDPTLATLPDADVLVGIPEPFGVEVVKQAAVGYLRRVDVLLQDLRVRKSGSVNTRILFGRVTPGLYSLDLRIHEVRGQLEAQSPETSIRGERIHVDLPVRIARGEGRATLRFEWDSRGLAGAVCGDFKAQLPIQGHVVSRTYHAKGTLDLQLEGDTLNVVPSFPDLTINLRVVPSQATWVGLERVRAEQSAGCRAALKLANHRELIEGLLEKGFDVTIPQRILRPLHRDLRVEHAVRMGERETLLRVIPQSLAATPSFLWYGAAVELWEATGGSVPSR